MQSVSHMVKIAIAGSALISLLSACTKGMKLEECGFALNQQVCIGGCGLNTQWASIKMVKNEDSEELYKMFEDQCCRRHDVPKSGCIDQWDSFRSRYQKEFASREEQNAIQKKEEAEKAKKLGY